MQGVSLHNNVFFTYFNSSSGKLVAFFVFFYFIALHKVANSGKGGRDLCPSRFAFRFFRRSVDTPTEAVIKPEFAT